MRYLWLAGLIAATFCSPVRAQFNLSQPAQPELSGAIYLDEATAPTRSHLERAQAFAAAGQWDEVVATLRQVMQNSGDQLLPVPTEGLEESVDSETRSPRDTRYITVRDYCHWRISQLPPDGLTLYRQQVDPEAAQLLEQGLTARDTASLQRIVRELFNSTAGDQALLALADAAISAGDFGTGRGYLLMLLPGSAPPAPFRLAYPDSEIPREEILARWVLSQILGGNEPVARASLARFAEQYPQAEGRLAGRTGKYHETLAALLAESASWEAAHTTADWPTFGGSFTRNKIATASGNLTGWTFAWQVPLEPQQITDTSLSQHYGYRSRRVAEDNSAPLSHFPVVTGDLVITASGREIHVHNLRTGLPAWGRDSLVFRDDSPQLGAGAVTLGVERFTLTVSGTRLYARIGSAVTTRANQLSARVPQGRLICLDLTAEGRLVWDIAPESTSWAFEGAPVVSGDNVYIAMRQSDVRPQAHVACFDAANGRLKWRRLICGAESPGRGQLDEKTHGLLTLHGDTLYFNTQLGAVAAVNAHDGAIRWLATYPRDPGLRTAGQQRGSARGAHYYRDLTPCIYDEGQVYVAPADSPAILAFDAMTGLLLWQKELAGDVVHLLGVSQGKLLASGDRLYWLNLLEQGRIDHAWPDSNQSLGFGRGLLAGNYVLWPTREEIRIFDTGTAQQLRGIPLAYERGAIEQLRQQAAGGPPIGQPRITGGNLLLSNDYLLIAGTDRLVAFRHRGPVRPASQTSTSAVQNPPPQSESFSRRKSVDAPGR